MALLVYLANNAGHTVTREQLFEALWPGVVVSDDTLTQAVIKLRKALGDSAKNPRYVQTVPKRGYRLLAEVSASSDNAASQGDLHSKYSFYFSAVAIVVFAALGLFFYLGEDSAVIPVNVSARVTAADRLPSLTVQPFVLLGEDDSQAYLAQGLTHDLITDLSRLSGLWVIGSRSIMGQRRETSGNITVGYRVSGELQRDGDQIRVHVHLFDVGSGRQIWSERYHRSFENLFEIQEQISRSIAETLSLKVSEAELWRLAQRYTQNVQAYEHFLQAQSSLLVRVREENTKARQFYRQAIDIDPSFSRAYAGLALSYAADYRNQWVLDGDKSLEQARRMARTALEIDPDIPEVYWVLAYVSTQQREHEKALRFLRKAVSLDQSFADAYALMGGINTYMGQADETPNLIRTAIRLNPDAGYLYYLLLGRAYFFMQDWEQSEINLSEALVRNPANLEAHIYLAAMLEASGDHNGAAWEAEEIRSLRADFDFDDWLATYPMTDQDQIRQLYVLLMRLGLAVGEE